MRFCLHTTKTETPSSLEPKWNPKGPLLALPCGADGGIRDPRLCFVDQAQRRDSQYFDKCVALPQAFESRYTPLTLEVCAKNLI